MNHEPLTDEEINELRELLEAEKRMRWLRSNIRIYAAYIAGAILTAFATWKAISEYLSIKVGIR